MVLFSEAHQYRLQGFYEFMFFVNSSASYCVRLELTVWLNAILITPTYVFLGFSVIYLPQLVSVIFVILSFGDMTARLKLSQCVFLLLCCYRR